MTDQRLQATEHACIELAARGEPVTFVTIAGHTGIPTVTLYRNPSLRAVVEEHRARARGATTLTGLAAQLASSNSPCTPWPTRSAGTKNSSGNSASADNPDARYAQITRAD